MARQKGFEAEGLLGDVVQALTEGIQNAGPIPVNVDLVINTGQLEAAIRQMDAFMARMKIAPNIPLPGTTAAGKTAAEQTVPQKSGRNPEVPAVSKDGADRFLQAVQKFELNVKSLGESAKALAAAATTPAQSPLNSELLVAIRALAKSGYGGNAGQTTFLTDDGVVAGSSRSKKPATATSTAQDPAVTAMRADLTARIAALSKDPKPTAGSSIDNKSLDDAITKINKLFEELGDLGERSTVATRTLRALTETLKELQIDFAPLNEDQKGTTVRKNDQLVSQIGNARGDFTAIQAERAKQREIETRTQSKQAEVAKELDGLKRQLAEMNATVSTGSDKIESAIDAAVKELQSLDLGSLDDSKLEAGIDRFLRQLAASGANLEALGAVNSLVRSKFQGTRMGSAANTFDPATSFVTNTNDTSYDPAGTLTPSEVASARARREAKTGGKKDKKPGVQQSEKLLDSMVAAEIDDVLDMNEAKAAIRETLKNAADFKKRLLEFLSIGDNLVTKVTPTAERKDPKPTTRSAAPQASAFSSAASDGFSTAGVKLFADFDWATLVRSLTSFGTALGTATERLRGFVPSDIQAVGAQRAATSAPGVSTLTVDAASPDRIDAGAARGVGLLANESLVRLNRKVLSSQELLKQYRTTTKTYREFIQGIAASSAEIDTSELQAALKNPDPIVQGGLDAAFENRGDILARRNRTLLANDVKRQQTADTREGALTELRTRYPNLARALANSSNSATIPLPQGMDLSIPVARGTTIKNVTLGSGAEISAKLELEQVDKALKRIYQTETGAPRIPRSFTRQDFVGEISKAFSGSLDGTTASFSGVPTGGGGFARQDLSQGKGERALRTRLTPLLLEVLPRLFKDGFAGVDLTQTTGPQIVEIVKTELAKRDLTRGRIDAARAELQEDLDRNGGVVRAQALAKFDRLGPSLLVAQQLEKGELQPVPATLNPNRVVPFLNNLRKFEGFQSSEQASKRIAAQLGRLPNTPEAQASFRLYSDRAATAQVGRESTESALLDDIKNGGFGELLAASDLREPFKVREVIERLAAGTGPQEFGLPKGESLESAGELKKQLSNILKIKRSLDSAIAKAKRIKGTDNIREARLNVQQLQGAFASAFESLGSIEGIFVRPEKIEQFDVASATLGRGTLTKGLERQLSTREATARESALRRRRQDLEARIKGGAVASITVNDESFSEVPRQLVNDAIGGLGSANSLLSQARRLVPKNVFDNLARGVSPSKFGSRLGTGPQQAADLIAQFRAQVLKAFDESPVLQSFGGSRPTAFQDQVNLVENVGPALRALSGVGRKLAGPRDPLPGVMFRLRNEALPESSGAGTGTALDLVSAAEKKELAAFGYEFVEFTKKQIADIQAARKRIRDQLATPGQGVRQIGVLKGLETRAKLIEGLGGEFVKSDRPDFRELESFLADKSGDPVNALAASISPLADRFQDNKTADRTRYQQNLRDLPRLEAARVELSASLSSKLEAQQRAVGLRAIGTLGTAKSGRRGVSPFESADKALGVFAGDTTALDLRPIETAVLQPEVTTLSQQLQGVLGRINDIARSQRPLNRSRREPKGSVASTPISPAALQNASDRALANESLPAFAQFTNVTAAAAAAGGGGGGGNPPAPPSNDPVGPNGPNRSNILVQILAELKAHTVLLGGGGLRDIGETGGQVNAVGKAFTDLAATIRASNIAISTIMRRPVQENVIGAIRTSNFLTRQDRLDESSSLKITQTAEERRKTFAFKQGFAQTPALPIDDQTIAVPREISKVALQELLPEIRARLAGFNTAGIGVESSLAELRVGGTPLQQSRSLRGLSAGLRKNDVAGELLLGTADQAVKSLPKAPALVGVKEVIDSIRSEQATLRPQLELRNAFRAAERNAGRKGLTPERKAELEGEQAAIGATIPGGIVELEKTIRTKRDTIQQGLGQIAGAMKLIEEAGSRTGRGAGLQSFANSLRTLSQYAGAGAIVFGAVSVVRSAFRELVGFEAELTRVQGILGVTSVNVRDKIQGDITAAASEYGVGIRDALEAFKVFAQAGDDRNKAITRTRASLSAVQALGIAPGQAQELLIATGNITNDRVSPNAVLDRISQVERTNAVTSQDLSIAIQRVGSIAQQFQPNTVGGIDAIDLVSGLATEIIEKTRVSGNQAATSLRFILARLSSPEIATKLQNNFGVNLGGRNSGELRPLSDILQDIGAKFKALNESGQTVKAGELLATFAGARQINAATALFEDFNKVLDIATESSRAFGDTQRRLALQQGTLEFQFKQISTSLSGQFELFVRNSGVLTGLKTVVGVGAAGTSGALGVAAKNPGLGVAASIGVPVAAFGALQFGAARAAAAGLGTLATALTGMSVSPVLIGIAAIGTLVGLLALLGKAVTAFKGTAGAEQQADEILAGARERVQDVPQFKEFGETANSLGTTRRGLIDVGLEGSRAGLAALKAKFGTDDFDVLRAQLDEKSLRTVRDTFDNASVNSVRDGLGGALQARFPDQKEQAEFARSLLRQALVQERAVPENAIGKFGSDADAKFVELEKVKGLLPESLKRQISLRRVSQRTGEEIPGAAQLSGLASTLGTFGSVLEAVINTAKSADGTPLLSLVQRSKSTNIGQLLQFIGATILNPELTGAQQRLRSAGEALALQQPGDKPLDGSPEFYKNARLLLPLTGQNTADQKVVADAFLQRQRFTEALGKSFDKELQTDGTGVALDRNRMGGVNSPDNAPEAVTTEILRLADVALQTRINDLRKRGTSSPELKRYEDAQKALQSSDVAASTRAEITRLSDSPFRGFVKDRLADAVLNFALASREIRVFGAAVKEAGGTFDALTERRNASQNFVKQLSSLDGEVFRNFAQVQGRLAQIELNRPDGTGVALPLAGEEGSAERFTATALKTAIALENPEVAEENSKQVAALRIQADQLDKQLSVLTGGGKNFDAFDGETRKLVAQVFALDGDVRRFFLAQAAESITGGAQQTFNRDSAAVAARENRVAAIGNAGDLGQTITQSQAQNRARQRALDIRLQALGGDRFGAVGKEFDNQQATLEERLKQIDLAAKNRSAVLAASPDGNIDGDRKRRDIEIGAGKEGLDAIDSALKAARDGVDERRVAQVERLSSIKESVVAPFTNALAEFFSNPGALTTGTGRGGAFGALGAALAGGFQSQLGRALSDNLFGENGILGKSLRNLMGDDPLLRGADAIKGAIDDGGANFVRSLEAVFNKATAAQYDRVKGDLPKSTANLDNSVPAAGLTGGGGSIPGGYDAKLFTTLLAGVAMADPVARGAGSGVRVGAKTISGVIAAQQALGTPDNALLGLTEAGIPKYLPEGYFDKDKQAMLRTQGVKSLGNLYYSSAGVLQYDPKRKTGKTKVSSHMVFANAPLLPGETFDDAEIRAKSKRYPLLPSPSGQAALDSLDPIARPIFDELLAAAKARGLKARVQEGSRPVQNNLRHLGEGNSWTLTSRHSMGTAIDLSVDSDYAAIRKMVTADPKLNAKFNSEISGDQVHFEVRSEELLAKPAASKRATSFDTVKNGLRSLVGVSPLGAQPAPLRTAVTDLALRELSIPDPVAQAAVGASASEKQVAAEAVAAGKRYVRSILLHKYASFDLGATTASARNDLGPTVAGMFSADLRTMRELSITDPTAQAAMDAGKRYMTTGYGATGRADSVAKQATGSLATLSAHYGKLPGSKLGKTPGLDATIFNEALKNGIDPNIAFSMFYQESRFNPNAKSPVGAEGVGQLMPTTITDAETRRDPHKNVAASSEFLGSLIKRFGSTERGLAGYNAGPGRVLSSDRTGKPLPAETRKYVPEIMARAEAGPQVSTGKRLAFSLMDGFANVFSAGPQFALGLDQYGKSKLKYRYDANTRSYLGATTAGKRDDLYPSKYSMFRGIPLETAPSYVPPSLLPKEPTDAEVFDRVDALLPSRQKYDDGVLTTNLGRYGQSLLGRVMPTNYSLQTGRQIESTATKPKLGQTAQAFQQLGVFGANALGTVVGTRGANPNSGAQLGSQLGSTAGTIAGTAAGTAIGGTLGSAVPVLGTFIGAALGGWIGKQLAPGSKDQQSDPLQRIERNTRETITAIENQTGKLLDLNNRLINVPSSFAVPSYRPSDVGGGGGIQVSGGISITVQGSNDPEATAQAVYDRLQSELRTQATFVDSRGI